MKKISLYSNVDRIRSKSVRNKVSIIYNIQIKKPDINNKTKPLNQKKILSKTPERIKFSLTSNRSIFNNKTKKFI